MRAVKHVSLFLLVLAACSSSPPTGSGSGGATAGTTAASGASSSSGSSSASAGSVSSGSSGTTSATGSTSAGSGSSGSVACSLAYRSAVLADEPLAEYPMDEASGTAMQDAAAPVVNGSYGAAVVLGAAGLVPSSAEGAPQFPGGVYAAADVAQVPANAQLEPAAALSVEFVFEEDAANDGSVSDGFIDLVTEEWSVQLDPQNHMHFWLPTANGNVELADTTAVSPGVPHLVDVTYDGSAARLYLDGQLDASGSGSGAIDYSRLRGTGLSIGGSALAPQRASLKGRIAQVALFGTALSAAQIAAHRHAAGLDGAAPCQAGSSGSSGSTGTTAVTGSSSGSSSGSSGSSGSTGTAGPNFPRLASLLIATTGTSGAVGDGYDANYVQWASKLNLNIFGANWVGAGSSMYGGSREAFVQAIHRQSSIGSKALQYFITDNTYEFWPMSDVSAWTLYLKGTSGTCAPNQYNTSWCNTNQTLFMPPDSNGLHLEGAFAEQLIATLIDGSGVDAAPDLDGTFHDNTALTPTAAGDYNRDGTTDAAGDATAGQWLRDGLAEGFTYQRAHSSLMPIGNIAGWGLPNAVGGGTDATGLDGLLAGGLIEGTFGDNWSAETWSGFAATKAQYQFCMAHTAAPKWVIVHHAKLAADGSDPVYSNGSPTGARSAPYQAMRYSLAFTLMDDGYYATTQESYYNTERNWFDEFAVNPTTGVALSFPDVDSGLGYLGQPTDPAWPAPLSNGVYERHFANAATGKTWLVLLNPKGNGAQTVSLGRSMKHLTGTQDPAVNDGSTVTSVTLQDRDGLILMSP